MLVEAEEEGDGLRQEAYEEEQKKWRERGEEEENR